MDQHGNRTQNGKAKILIKPLRGPESELCDDMIMIRIFTPEIPLTAWSNKCRVRGIRLSLEILPSTPPIASSEYPYFLFHLCCLCSLFPSRTLPLHHTPSFFFYSSLSPFSSFSVLSTHLSLFSSLSCPKKPKCLAGGGAPRNQHVPCKTQGGAPRGQAMENTSH